MSVKDMSRLLFNFLQVYYHCKALWAPLSGGKGAQQILFSSSKSNSSSSSSNSSSSSKRRTRRRRRSQSQFGTLSKQDMGRWGWLFRRRVVSPPPPFSTPQKGTGGFEPAGRGRKVLVRSRQKLWIHNWSAVLARYYHCDITTIVPSWLLWFHVCCHTATSVIPRLSWYNSWCSCNTKTVMMPMARSLLYHKWCLRELCIATITVMPRQLSLITTAVMPQSVWC